MRINMMLNTSTNSKFQQIICSLLNAHCSMRNAILLILPLLLLTWSCEEDFNINAPYKDISVVFGLLDPGEDTILLKINKAFLGEGNVMEMAKIEDSSVYVNGLDATIEEWENGSFIKSYKLDTVTIKNKEEGIFYNPYQIIYYTPYEPVTTRTYLLKVVVNNKTLTAQTDLVNNFSISKPSAGSKFIMFRPGSEGDIEWTSAKNGKRYEILIRIKYKEVLLDSPDTVYTYVDWSMGTKKSVDDNGGEEMKVAYSNDGFYNLIANEIPYTDAAVEANVKERYTNDVDFIIAVAAVELNTYMEVNEPSNSIIQDRPEYTNIENGTGIFSSRFRNTRTKKLHPETIQTIKSDLPQLKFVY
jgi:hypothetical protein